MFIRRAVPGDQTAVRALHAAAFARPGVVDEPPEAGLVDELRRAGDLVLALSLVAVDADGVVVGHVAGSAGHVDGAARPLVAIGPVGVAPGWQRQGVGSALMHAVLGAADGLDEPAVVLLGAPAFYSRFGFEPASALGIMPEYDEWQDDFQIRRLTAWSDDLSGVFHFPSAFPGIDPG